MDWNVTFTQIFKNKGKKTDMPFEEIEILTAPVHYVYICRKKKKRRKKVKPRMILEGDEGEDQDYDVEEED